MLDGIKNKHVLITGGARGIGFGVAELFVRGGARVSIIDFNEENLLTVKEDLSEKSEWGVIGIKADVSNRKEVHEAIKKAEKIAPVDVLINNAGIAFETPFLDIEDSQWDKIININLKGMFMMCQEVLKFMVKRKAGIIINMGSKNGLDGEFGYAHYNASKGGVIMLTKTLALEFAHLGIRTNAICPGYIETPMSKEIDSPEFVKQFVDRYVPANRPGNVEEIARIFLFLASEGSSFINGQVIIADGGQLAGQKPFPNQLI